MKKFDWWGCAMVALAYLNGYMDGRVSEQRRMIRHEIVRINAAARSLRNTARTVGGK